MCLLCCLGSRDLSIESLQTGMEHIDDYFALHINIHHQMLFIAQRTKFWYIKTSVKDTAGWDVDVYMYIITIVFTWIINKCFTCGTPIFHHSTLPMGKKWRLRGKLRKFSESDSVSTEGDLGRYYKLNLKLRVESWELRGGKWIIFGSSSRWEGSEGWLTSFHNKISSTPR